MSAPELERIFERFYRADNTGKVPGSGLGMPIVKEISDHHQGNLNRQ